MASYLEMEAQETDALLEHEAPHPASRPRAPAIIALLVGATLLVAIGTKAGWGAGGGARISERDAMGADWDPAAGVWNPCSNEAEDCSKTLCCNDPANRCFRKDEHWSTCNRSCDSNMAWEETGWVRQENHTWDCQLLDSAHDGENCLYSKKCKDDGSHCFKKSEHWASCNKTCSNNMMWENDAWVEKDEHVWDCHILSEAHDGMNCMESKKCKNPDSHCFLKDEHWASCNATCQQNSQWNNETNVWEQSEEPAWNCKTLSCVSEGENCLDSRCCKSPGSTCFKKNEHWATCNATCTSSYDWVDGGWKDHGEGEKLWSCEELAPEDHDDAPPCDLSECDGCQGEQCTSCRESKERDCCLANFCDGVTEEGMTEKLCKENNMATCCEGMSAGCNPSAGGNETVLAPDAEAKEAVAAPEEPAAEAGGSAAAPEPAAEEDTATPEAISS